MMPNMDPRAMKSMLAKMGIKTEDIDAAKVVIESNDKTIVIENPQITKISAQGNVSFQITGSIKEEMKSISIEITEDDIKLVMQSSGVNDEKKAKEALERNNGDIAAAILDLKNQ